MSDADLLTWVAIGAMAAWMAWSRFAGKTPSADARKLVAEGGRLVDVRTPMEFASGHIEGAQNLPLDVLGARVDELGPRDCPVVVYCRSGARSARAAGLLRAAGFTRVADLGAMSRW